MKQSNSTIGNKIIDFYCRLTPDFALPEGIAIMHPYQENRVRKTVSAFYHKFYNDTNPRVLILGINPGRLGAGITGISFTDPVRLKEICGISNDFEAKKELSGEFIYEMIAAYGGAEKFYSRFLLSSICPLGFVKAGKNLNYYDIKALQSAATPFIVEGIKKQKAIMEHPPVCLCLGEGKNFAFFQRLNNEHQFFSHLLSLPHPRYVMQYKRKQKAEYIQMYLEKLKESLRLTATAKKPKTL